MLYQVFSYLKFLLRSTNRHGIHSPFVYDLVTLCLNDRTVYEEYDILLDYRTSLQKDQTKIEVRDLGAGSHVFKNGARSVAGIARHAGSTFRENKLLFRLCHYLKPERMLELGTSLGLGTLSMALGNRDGEIISVEGCASTSAMARRYLQRFQVENTELIVSSFSDYLENKLSPFDLAFIDGNHSREAVLQCYAKLKAMAHNDSLVIFDDIYWSPGMTSAWQEIISDEEAAVTLDLFRMGLVFFRKEQKKQHFVIRL